MTHKEYLDKLDHIVFMFGSDMLVQGEGCLDVANIYNEKVWVRVKVKDDGRVVNTDYFLGLMEKSLTEHGGKYFGLTPVQIGIFMGIVKETNRRIQVGEQEYYEFRFNLYAAFKDFVEIV